MQLRLSRPFIANPPDNLTFLLIICLFCTAILMIYRDWPQPTSDLHQLASEMRLSAHESAIFVTKVQKARDKLAVLSKRRGHIRPGEREAIQLSLEKELAIFLTPEQLKRFERYKTRDYSILL